MIIFYTLIAILRQRTGTLASAGKLPRKDFRSTPLFLHFSQAVHRTIPATSVLTFAYFLLAAVLCTTTSTTNDTTAQVGGILLAGSLALLYITRDISNHFLMTMLAVSVLLITFVLNQGPATQFNSSHVFLQLSSIIQLCLLVVVLLHLLFRKPGEHLLSGLDYLVIGISAFVTIIAWQHSPSLAFPFSILKGLNIYLALKLVMSREKLPAQMILGSVLTVLVVIVVRGVF
jgi:hypothetical protein